MHSNFTVMTSIYSRTIKTIIITIIHELHSRLYRRILGLGRNMDVHKQLQNVSHSVCGVIEDYRVMHSKPSPSIIATDTYGHAVAWSTKQ